MAMLRQYASQGRGQFAQPRNDVELGEQLKVGEKLAEGLEEKLDAQLELEFKQWLTGKHPKNCAPAFERQAEVMDVIRDETNNYNPPFDPHGSPRQFAHTWWRTNDLKHLPGVRDYLDVDERQLRDEKVKMSKLAYFGPQNIEEAWMYFKTFVKKLDNSPDGCSFDPLEGNDWRNYPANQGDPTDKSDLDLVGGILAHAVHQGDLGVDRTSLAMVLLVVLVVHQVLMILAEEGGGSIRGEVEEDPSYPSKPHLEESTIPNLEDSTIPMIGMRGSGSNR
jgi:hypothetical protein